jgi:inward rectifier potassium channel
LGSRVAEQSRQRFINPDGSFNVVRHGLSFWEQVSPYQFLLTISTVHFVALVATAYLLTNLLFAAAYVACGPGAFHGAEAIAPLERFLEAFFFSVQTLATIGYGKIAPASLAANVLVTLEALTGLLGLALVTGMIFARFSRPSAQIIFSRNAVVAPFREGFAFQFRIANQRNNQLVNVELTVVLSRFEERNGRRARRFYPLELERRRVMFFPLHWVINHPITETSPLYGITHQDLVASDTEFLILLTATDDTSSQTVHARSSYKYDEVVWNARFQDIFLEDTSGIDLRRIHDMEKL